jgi:putative ABC transport system substrate-binding protein
VPWWPLAARAQQGERMRRLGVLLPAAVDDSQYQTWVGAFLQELALLGWSIGRNVQIDTRWATANAAQVRRHAAELAALARTSSSPMARHLWWRCCR